MGAPTEMACPAEPTEETVIMVLVPPDRPIMERFGLMYQVNEPRSTMRNPPPISTAQKPVDEAFFVAIFF